MKETILENNNKNKGEVYKVHKFFFLMMIWSTIVQFWPVGNMYQPIALFLPAVLYLYKNKDAYNRIIDLCKPLKVKAALVIIIIWICTRFIDGFTMSLVEHFFGDGMGKLIEESVVEEMLWQSILFTAIFPAFFEELILRGIILDGYRKKKVLITAIMNGFIFGIFHMNFLQFVIGFTFGILAVYLVKITGSIFSTVLIHFVNNACSVILSHFDTSTETEVTQMGINDFVVLAIWAIIGLAVAIILIKYLNKIYGYPLEKINEAATSTEKTIDWPIIVSTIIFILFSILLLAALSL